MDYVNIFKRYDAKENQFTNALISILRLSTIEDTGILASFLHDELGLIAAGKTDTFRVLEGIDGTADAELAGDDYRVLFETKIASGSLRELQIKEHLAKLRNGSQSA